MSNEVAMANKIVFFCLYTIFLPLVRTNEPTWKELQKKLEQRLAEVFDDRLQVYSGEFFKYKISGEFSYEVGIRFVSVPKVDYQGSKELPKWLHFDSKKNRLQGVPTDGDIKNDIKIEFRKKSENSINGMDSDVRRLTIDVRPSREQRLFKCKDDNLNPYVGSVIFYDDIQKFTGNERVHIMREFASRLDAKLQDLYLEIGNRMDKVDVIEQMPQMAGPGDKNIGDKVPMFTISWVIHCGNDLAGSKPLALLRRLSETQDFSSEFSVKVLGWLVTSFRSHKLYKRDIGNSGGTISVLAATPTLLLPSPTTISAVKTVRPSPTTSFRAMTSTSIPPAKITTPPVKPTTEVVTTKKPTTIATITPVKVSPTSNQPPKVLNNIKKFKVLAMKALEETVPPDVFYDPESQYLTISLNRLTNTNELQKLQAGDWIEYINKKIYMLPGKENIGIHQFSLTAKDPLGSFTNAMFSVEVLKDHDHKNIFNLTLNENFTIYNKSVQKRVELIKNLASATKHPYDDFRAIEILPGSVILKWAVKGLDDCNNPQVQAYVEMLSSSIFKKDFEHEVLSGGNVDQTDCFAPLPFHKGSDSALLERIIIPVFAVIIILIIIAIILCCVYRRRQKFQPKDDDAYVRNHKKPVIFREEYEEKQPAFVSLQPLILPNEKPPVPTAYEPKLESQESNGSDDKVYLTPGSPKDNSRKGYNAPPPYSSR